MAESAKKCPITFTLGILSGKWKLAVLARLLAGPRRFKQLEREVTGITPKVLVKELKELERDGIVRREAFATVPVTVEYSLTAAGLSLQPIVAAIKQWGKAQLGDAALDD